MSHRETGPLGPLFDELQQALDHVSKAFGALQERNLNNGLAMIEASRRLGIEMRDSNVDEVAARYRAADTLVDAMAGGAEPTEGVAMAGEDLEQGDLLVRAADSAMRIEEARYTECDISDEQTRMYEFGTGVDRYRHVIVEPRTLVFRHGGSTHRVIDSEGVVHCVPAPGHQACVLTWYPKDPSNPIQF